MTNNITYKKFDRNQAGAVDAGTTFKTTDTGGVHVQHVNVDTLVFPTAQLDGTATRAVMTIDYEHHEIHSGSHFFYHDAVELGVGGIQDYGLVTPNTTSWIHLTPRVTGSAITQYEIFEATDKTVTTQQTVFNNDRNSIKVPGLKVYKGTSGGTTDGVRIAWMKSGSASQQSRAGAEAARSDEIILKQNTKYIIRVTSFTAANLTNIALVWYEHTNVG